MQSANETLERTWIALDQAIGGFVRGDEGYFDPDDAARRCALIGHKGDALVVEAAEARNVLKVSFRKPAGRELKDRMVWMIRFADEYREVSNVADTNGRPASRQSITRLNNVLWQFHRLTVENAARVLRN